MPSVDVACGAAGADQDHALQKIKSHPLEYAIDQRDGAGKAFLRDHISDRMIEHQDIDFIKQNNISSLRQMTDHFPFLSIGAFSDQV